MAKIQKPQINCQWCYAPLEKPEWKYYHTEYNLTALARCQSCGWVRKVVLAKETKND